MRASAYVHGIFTFASVCVHVRCSYLNLQYEKQLEIKQAQVHIQICVAGNIPVCTCNIVIIFIAMMMIDDDD